MKKLFIVVLLLLLPAVAFADATCTDQASCQTAVNAAVDGDTITLTANDSAWNTPLTISGKGIHFKGSSGAISISGTANPLISIDKDATNHVEISDLTTAGPAIDISGTGKSVIIHGLTASNSTVDGIITFYVNGAVVYNCAFLNSTPDVKGVYGLQAKNISGLSDWQTASTLGNADTDGERNIYIEGCTFDYFTDVAIDTDDASRVVIRNCTFNNSAIAGHGFCSSAIGARTWEINRNDFVYTEYTTNRGNVSNGWVKLRGGTGVVTGNNFGVFGSYWGSKPSVSLSVWEIGSGENCGQSGCASSYPATRQIGQGHNGTSYITDPVYIWSNTNLGTLELDGNEPYCGTLTITDVLQANRDYYLATKSGYTEYTCPHPLAGTGSCTGVGASGYSVSGGAPPAVTGVPVLGASGKIMINSSGAPMVR